MITLLIPTMNRSDFLIRQLRYYEKTGFTGYICIGDSSEDSQIARTRGAISKLKNNINIIYKEYPGTSDGEVLKRLLDFVVTPYAAFVADDDFLVPTALEQCIIFLENHNEYSSVHGKSLTIYLKSEGAYGGVVGARDYPLPIVEGEPASMRIKQHLGHYSVTLFGVHRMESWRKMYQDISGLADRTFAAELMPCCLSVIFGKAKEIDCLYLVRQDHPHRYLLPEARKWVSNPNWLSQYEIFLGFLVKALVEEDNTSKEQAGEVVEQAFGDYMTNLLGREWRKFVGKETQVNKLRQVIRTVPGALPIWSVFQSWKHRRPNDISLLKSILQPASPFHREFMTIYSMVTENNLHLDDYTFGPTLI